MKSKLWLLNMGFIPLSADLALLFLRIALGVSMIALHGWDKVVNYQDKLAVFPDPLGIGRHAGLLLAIMIEMVCSALLVIGALTRFAAAILALTMCVAVFMVHHGDLTRAGGGEPAALYLFGFITILLAGGGRFSADGAGGPWALAAFGGVAGAVTGYPLSICFQPRDREVTGTMQQYLTNFRSVLSDDSLQWTAIGVWVAMVLILAIAGYFIGRALHRRRVRVVVPAAPDPPPL